MKFKKITTNKLDLIKFFFVLSLMIYFSKQVDTNRFVNLNKNNINFNNNDISNIVFEIWIKTSLKWFKNYLLLIEKYEFEHVQKNETFEPEFLGKNFNDGSAYDYELYFDYYDYKKSKAGEEFITQMFIISIPSLYGPQAYNNYEELYVSSTQEMVCNIPLYLKRFDITPEDLQEEVGNLIDKNTYEIKNFMPLLEKAMISDDYRAGYYDKGLIFEEHFKYAWKILISNKKDFESFLMYMKYIQYEVENGLPKKVSELNSIKEFIGGKEFVDLLKKMRYKTDFKELEFDVELNWKNSPKNISELNEFIVKGDNSEIFLEENGKWANLNDICDYFKSLNEKNNMDFINFKLKTFDKILITSGVEGQKNRGESDFIFKAVGIKVILDNEKLLNEGEEIFENKN